ncbi:jg20203 [Pararge aegeria aegeria]|uniref:Jg20203 protein n=1 Tax=Pararge aegeria aegeria TaxID=348720 RepID=A0A8S4R891_9NEOP|nr:jg20203 [Pararge aegeria aegeria]
MLWCGQDVYRKDVPSSDLASRHDAAEMPVYITHDITATPLNSLLQSTAGLNASPNWRICPHSPRWAGELVIAVDGSSSTEHAAARSPIYSLSRLVRHPREKEDLRSG